MIQKSEHEGSIHVGQHQAAWRLVPMVTGKLKQEAETVAISCNGLRTRVALTNQPLQKECLHKFGEPIFRR